MGRALAQALNVASTRALHTVGEEFHDEKTGKKYIYVLANTLITQYDVCAIDSAFGADPGTDTLVNTVNVIGFGVAPATIAAASYGWIQVFGDCTIHCAKDTVMVGPYFLGAAGGRLTRTGTYGLAVNTSLNTSRLIGIFVTTTCYSHGSAAGGFVNFPRRLQNIDLGGG